MKFNTALQLLYIEKWKLYFVINFLEYPEAVSINIQSQLAYT